MYGRKKMSKTYFSDDGNYGDATCLVILDNHFITDEVWDLIDQARDNDRFEIARALYVHDFGYLEELALEYDVDLKISCAWCAKPVMWEWACPNAEDICVNCCSDCDGGIDE